MVHLRMNGAVDMGDEIPQWVHKAANVRAQSIDKYISLRLDTVAHAINQIIDIMVYIRPQY